MKYKLVVCDMDGTLLNSNHSISDYTKKIINEIKEKNIKIIIATGRPYLDARYFREHLNLQSYLITSNGARAHDENDNVIVKENIDSKLVNEIISYKVDKDIYHRNLYVDDEWFIENEIEGLVEFHKESGYSFKITDFNKFKGDNVAKAFYLSEIQKNEILEKKLKEKFENKLTVTTSSPFCLEIMKKGVSKGKTLKKIVNNLGISLGEVIAFGDGLNDYEMLSIVDKGFVMGNATDKLKEKLPNNEIIDTCNNDGVAKKLKEIFL